MFLVSEVAVVVVVVVWLEFVFAFAFLLLGKYLYFECRCGFSGFVIFIVAVTVMNGIIDDLSKSSC